MILAIDTSSSFLVLGLRGEGTSLELAREVGRGHAEQLPGAITELFATAGVPAKAQRIVVGIGPGSYTGLRVGASHALGLGRAWNASVLGVSSLEAIAARAEGTVAVSVDARRGQVYGAVYEVTAGLVTATISEPGKRPLEEFERLAAGHVWLQDQPPGGLALTRLADTRGQSEWQLQYA